MDSNCEIQIIKFYGKNGGFASQDSLMWKARVYNNLTKSHWPIKEQTTTKKYVVDAVSEFKKVLDVPVVEYEEKRTYTTSLVKFDN